MVVLPHAPDCSCPLSSCKEVGALSKYMNNPILDPILGIYSWDLFWYHLLYQSGCWQDTDDTVKKKKRSSQKDFSKGDI